MWNERGADGIIVGSMTEGIAKAIEIEKSKTDELYFIDIIADEINFLPQLKILSEETIAPILVATYHFNEEQHLDVLNNGADFYAQLSQTPERNIDGVLAVINSIRQRARKPNPPSNSIIHHGIILAPSYRNTVFAGNHKIELTRREFDILHYLMLNHGKVLTYKQIYNRVWGSEYEDASPDVLRNAISRLREKLRIEPGSTEYIKTVLEVGYSFPERS